MVPYLISRVRYVSYIKKEPKPLMVPYLIPRVRYVSYIKKEPKPLF